MSALPLPEESDTVVDLGVYRERRDESGAALIEALEDSAALLALCEIHETFDAAQRRAAEMRDHVKGAIRPMLSKKSTTIGNFTIRLSDKTSLYCKCHHEVATACPHLRDGEGIVEVYAVPVDPWLSIKKQGQE